MRLSIGFAVVAMLLAGPARADTLDLSTIKCQDFIKSSKDNIGVIAMWLHGYYAGKGDESTVIDFYKFAKDAEKLGKYCGENPAHGLITAAEKVFSD
jgi:acid stress chaperone HdeB